MWASNRYAIQSVLASLQDAPVPQLPGGIVAGSSTPVYSLPTVSGWRRAPRKQFVYPRVVVGRPPIEPQRGAILVHWHWPSGCPCVEFAHEDFS